MEIAKYIKRSKHGIMTLSTNSTSATWSPTSITNAGTTLTWVATGAVTDTQFADDPTFDFSASGGGTTNISVAPISQMTAFNMNTLNITAIDLTYMQSLTNIIINTNAGITSIDVSNLNSLVSFNSGSCTGVSTITNYATTNSTVTNFGFNNNNISTFDYTKLSSLTSSNCSTNSLTTVDLTGCTGLVTFIAYSNSFGGAALDQIYIDLDNNGQSGGTLHVDSGRTAASDTARANLITKSWTITP